MSKAPESQPESAAYTCLSCGHRTVVSHGDGYKCRDCGAEESYDAAVERYKGFAEQIGWEDVEIALRAVLVNNDATEAAMCLKDLGWAVVRDD